MRVTEFCIGDRVRFTADAEVSDATKARSARVEGYVQDPASIAVKWLVIVSVEADAPYEQWVAAGEIELIEPRGVRRHVEEWEDEEV